MYNKPEFAADDAESIAIIDAHPLAQLVVSTPSGIAATPVPMVRRGDSLVGHVARPNQLWQHAGEALAIFNGPDAYVSPNWYPSKAEQRPSRADLELHHGACARHVADSRR